MRLLVFEKLSSHPKYLKGIHSQGLTHGSFGAKAHKTFIRAIHCSAALAARMQSSRPKDPKTANKDTDSLDWGRETIRLSDKLKKRLNKREDTGPIIAVEEKLLKKQSPTKSPSNSEPVVKILDVRESRPITGETLEALTDAGPDLSPYCKIKSSEYIKSSLEASAWPKATMPEIAVIGRSNVGKSSLINMITSRRELALVSKTPGKTRCINHFLINKAWYLVDLPGYGYARVSKDSKFVWGKHTQQFFLSRPSLLQVLLLVDATVPTQQIDLDCAQWLYENGIPYSVIYTKLDKRKKKCLPPLENIAKFEECMREFMPVLPGSVATSASEKQGKDELLMYLAALRLHVGYNA